MCLAIQAQSSASLLHATESLSRLFKLLKVAAVYNVMSYTRYTAKLNFYKFRVKTNTGKQSVSLMAIDIWKDLLSSLKDLRVFAFPKYIKRYLVSEQKLN